MAQSFSSQDKTLIISVDLQSRSEIVITENFLTFALDLIVDLYHKCLQQLHTGMDLPQPPPPSLISASVK